MSFALRNVEKWDIMRIGFVSVEENMKVEYIIGIATFVIGSGGIVAVAKSIFPNWGLKNQKKIELNTELAKDKINAIKKVIKLEQEANIIEDVNIVHPELFNVKSNNPKEDWTIYMTIVEDRKKLGEFLNKLHEIRKYEDTWLSRRVSAYLLYAEKYVMQFMEFLKYLEYTENDLYPFGLLLAPDIQKWQRKLDGILVQELNDISFEIEHHEGKKWEHEKELLKDEYKKTVLYGLINKTDKEAMILLSAILTNYAVNVADESDSMEVVAQRLIAEGYLAIT